MAKKVLIFETRHVSPVIETSFSIVEDHLEKGDEVILVNITECMPHSFSHGYGIIPRLIAKNKLNNVVRNKPEHITYSRDPLIKCPKIQLPRFDTIKESAQFEVDGIDFGMALASTLVGKARQLAHAFFQRKRDGIEAVYWGKPSIVVGNSYYHQLGSVYYPQTVDELQKL